MGSFTLNQEEEWMLEFPLGILSDLISDESQDLEHGRYSMKIYWMKDAKHHYHNSLNVPDVLVESNNKGKI